MKTILLIVFLMGITLLGYAQKGITREIRGNNNRYIKSENEFNKLIFYK